MLSPLKGIKVTRHGIVRPPGDVAVSRAITTSADDVLGQVDNAILGRLKRGVDVEIPIGTQNIRRTMSDLSLVSGNEVALIRLADGTRVMRMGVRNAVDITGAKRIIAHTHPKGSLRFSQADLRALNARGQRSSVIISPRDDLGIRLPVQ